MKGFVVIIFDIMSTYFRLKWVGFNGSRGTTIMIHLACTYKFYSLGLIDNISCIIFRNKVHVIRACEVMKGQLIDVIAKDNTLMAILKHQSTK